MRTFSTWIAFGLLLLLTLGGGLIHGRLSNRWGPPEQMIEAGNRLNQISGEFGAWQVTASGHIEDSAKGMLQCAGDITRIYSDAAMQAKVDVSLLVGPAGTVSVHTPEVCFSTKNFELLGKRKRINVRDDAGTDHQFWMVEFRTKDLEERLLRVYYGWSTGGPWSAPDDARLEFAGSPYLYKLQLHENISPDGDTEEVGLSFLCNFLPEARAELVSATTIR
jgi:hypothetical protein